MKISEVFLTLLCVSGIAVGQILFKLAAASVSADGSFIQRWVNPYLICALCIYGLATLLWIWILRSVALHLAYPFMALAFLIVPVLGNAFLGEPFQAKVFYGGALIMLGVYISVR